MKLNFKNIAILGTTSLIVMSCSRNPDSPGYEYVPDMYRSQAIEAYVDYGMVKDVEYDSLKYKMSARVPAEGTIPFTADKNMAKVMMPYGIEDSQEGYTNSKANKIPMSYIESEDIANAHADEGKELYSSFCKHCHGEKGQGDGAVVTYGEFNPPSPYNAAYKDRTLGQIFHVITYGKGAMGPHASQVNKDERWKIAMYVRKLQHGDINYAELLKGRRIGEKENIFGEVDLPKIKMGTFVSLRNITFDVGSANLTNQGRAELDSLNAYLVMDPSVKLEISGHTDNTGDEAANVVLSKDRAIAVVNYLVSKGITAERLVAEGYGSSNPVAYNDTEEGRAKNRRIEFVKI